MANELDYIVTTMLAWLGGTTASIPNFMIPAGIALGTVITWFITTRIRGNTVKRIKAVVFPSAQEYSSSSPEIPNPDLNGNRPTKEEDVSYDMSVDYDIKPFVVTVLRNYEKYAVFDGGIEIEIYSKDNILTAKIRDGLIGKISVKPHESPVQEEQS